MQNKISKQDNKQLSKQDNKQLDEILKDLKSFLMKDGPGPYSKEDLAILSNSGQLINQVLTNGNVQTQTIFSSIAKAMKQKMQQMSANAQTAFEEVFKDSDETLGQLLELKKDRISKNFNVEENKTKKTTYPLEAKVDRMETEKSYNNERSNRFFRWLKNLTTPSQEKQINNYIKQVQANFKNELVTQVQANFKNELVKQEAEKLKQKTETPSTKKSFVLELQNKTKQPTGPSL